MNIMIIPQTLHDETPSPRTRRSSAWRVPRSVLRPALKSPTWENVPRAWET